MNTRKGQPSIRGPSATISMDGVAVMTMMTGQNENMRWRVAWISAHIQPNF